MYVHKKGSFLSYTCTYNMFTITSGAHALNIFFNQRFPRSSWRLRYVYVYLYKTLV